jgi:2'-5' RNA ligase
MNKPLGKYFIAVLPDRTTVRIVNNLRERYSGSIELPKSPVHITLKESFFTSNIDGLITRLE